MLTNYLISDQETLYHFFYKPGEGICFKEKNATHWNEYQILYRDGLDGFSAYCDSAGNIHLICTNGSHDIIYLFKRKEQWLKYVLASGKEEIIPLRFALSYCDSYMNLFYTASYSAEVVLVHCVLGNNAQPVTIDVLASDCADFFVFKNRVYYTNKQGVLGFQDASDGKPTVFESLIEGGRMPYLLAGDSKPLFVYKKKNTIYLEDTPIFEDYAANQPVLLKTDGKLILQWQSGSFIRYITSFNDGKTWSAPMRFISNGRDINCYQMQSGNDLEYYYGTHNSNELNIFGRPAPNAPFTAPQKDFRTTAVFHNSSPAEKPAVQEPPAEKNAPEKTTAQSQAASKPSPETDQIELQKLKIMIDMMANEVAELKKQIKVLASSLQ